MSGMDLNARLSAFQTLLDKGYTLDDINYTLMMAGMTPVEQTGTQPVAKEVYYE